MHDPTIQTSWNPASPNDRPSAGALPMSGLLPPNEKRALYAQLPASAQAYLESLAESVAVPISYLSTGPDRAEGCVYPGTFLEPLLG